VSKNAVSYTARASLSGAARQALSLSMGVFKALMPYLYYSKTRNICVDEKQGCLVARRSEALSDLLLLD
jgi:hypothetical protein